MKTVTHIPVSVIDVVRRPRSRRSVQISAAVPGLDASTSAVPAGAEIDLDLVLEAVSDTIVVTGSAVAPWRGECRRCLCTVDGVLTVRVREIFEAQPVEGETYLLAGDHIDLEPMVREAIMLELPLSPLCRPDCAGLCPACGADRNEADCGCDVTPGDPRWAALDDLRLEG